MPEDKNTPALTVRYENNVPYVRMSDPYTFGNRFHEALKFLLSPVGGVFWAHAGGGDDGEEPLSYEFMDGLAAAGSSCYRLPTLDEYDRIKAVSEDPAEHADGGFFDETDLDDALMGKVLQRDEWSDGPDEPRAVYTVESQPVTVTVRRMLGWDDEGGEISDRERVIFIGNRTTSEVAGRVVIAAQEVEA